MLLPKNLPLKEKRLHIHIFKIRIEKQLCFKLNYKEYLINR